MEANILYIYIEMIVMERQKQVNTKTIKKL